MNFEEALKAVNQSAHNSSPFSKEGEHAKQSRLVLYCTEYPTSREPNDAAKAFLNLPELQGEDFAVIGGGAHGFVVGNDKIAMKMGESHTSYPDSISPSQIPAGLAAAPVPGGEGEVNGVPYLAAERLNTDKRPEVKDIVSYLFKARKEGVVYADPLDVNFGYDACGELKALDLAHFEKFNPVSFGEAVKYAIGFSPETTSFPTAFSDKDNTFILMGHDMQPPSPKSFKRINAILNALGIDPSMAEQIQDVLIRIPASEITYGSPAQLQPLADVINQSLQTSKTADGTEKPNASPQK